ncbi:ATP-dependent RNA helicase HrpA [Modestobacter sp. VKM Ac-2979]|uniref:ATP-dependent RNA helicase HrpA n=1 Tax=unclassified Modestobacter TaxID=2643866 RepID=UPI0022AB9472|nr:MULTISPECIES: ATP-dependent RNA helicase HrpA [unclassified Modestobacter]MCZ2811401.1 ATP-dependent RNA helicase HrpA [Modestobacter sp. VKM Ac-2979]MCZ2840914.1 ATP-dependent RNA helicase HrpA [Modestobacter sp. VKM Ac-2980]
MTTPHDDLRSRLSALTLADEHRLRRRLDGTRRTKDPAARARQHEQIAADVAAAEERIARRRAAVPVVSYPEELPVSQRREDIAAALRDSQVVVVAGETGSGKTTQLPKILLELGRGVRGRIGHTQPRRLAARTVAERIAEEIGSPLGETVGWKVRFTDEVGDKTLVKLMTDGVLLAEVQRDRMLRQYDTIIIDEAHERSLNIDFLLGYLARLLPRRPDLKLVITSATIDVDRIAKHFSGHQNGHFGGGEEGGTKVPVVEVSGRTYPVEVRYRPVIDPDEPEADPDRDQTSAIVDACAELVTEGPGDVLVFLAGEREIRDTAEALGGTTERNGTPIDVLPLYSRLSAADQHKVFQAHTGRRIVLATNVAETSLTVPGIKYVVDPGTARISRYSHRTKVQRLPIEPVSQASARQRSGRCGRTSEGIAIRLYTQDDYDARPEYTDPEILRTNLASVLLQMASLDLGDVADFPFIDPPDRRAVADGLALLQELAALDGDGKLTETGRALAALPLDPRIARMVVEADRRGVLEEVLVIAAGLTVQDVRERPAEHQQAADELHKRFADENSDFLALLNLWSYLAERAEELSGNQFRRTVKKEFLHYLRIREWQDLHGQLRSTARRLGMTTGSLAPAPDERGVTASLLAGLLSQVGMQAEPVKDRSGKPGRPGREYLGTRNTRFVIAPGTPLAKKPPRWVVAAELVETSRLFARTVARVEPEVVERLADHLVNRQYSEPRWDAKRGSVVATERVTLYGLPLVVGRRVQYGSIDPVVSRELFIRHALVQGEWTTHHRFWAENQAAIERVAELEERARRRDIRVDDETVFELYDARVPADVVSTRHFDRWWKEARRTQPDLLTFTPEMLTNAAAAGQVQAEDYPDEVRLTQGLTLPLSYAFAPGAAEDGVTVDVPLGVLDTLAATSGESLAFTVPGQRAALVTELLRSLPKQLRRGLVPIPDRVREVLPHIDPTEPLLPALERELRRATSVVIPPDAWQPAEVPAHLRATFRVLDDQQRPLAQGKDLTALRAEVAPHARASLARAASTYERTGQTSWTFGDLPATVEVQRGGHVVTAYPALVDEGATVGVRVVATQAEATRLGWRGARRLLVLVAGAPVKQVVKGLGPRSRLALQFNPDGEIPDLVADCVDAAADELIAAGGGPPRTEAAFTALVASAREQLLPLTSDAVRRVEAVLTQAREVAIAIGAAPGRRVPEAAIADLRAQMGGLLHRGFVATAGRRRLPDLVRYLTAMAHRLEKLPANAARDELWTAQVAAVTAEYAQLRAAAPPTGAPDDPVTRVRWMIEELRVGLFAQTVGTPRPISEQRVYKAIDAISA